MGGGNNLFGLLSIIAGVLGAGCCCFNAVFPGILGIVALVLGLLHMQRVRQGTASNGMLGVIGIVLGLVALTLALCSGCTNTGADWQNDYSPFMNN